MERPQISPDYMCIPGADIFMLIHALLTLKEILVQLNNASFKLRI